MQIDSPSNFQSNLTAALAIFVNTDFLAVDEFVMTEGIWFAIEDVIDETFDFQRVR